MTADNVPFWYVLIDGLKEKRIIANGATIPYIIGAHGLVNNSFHVSDNSIHYLLTEISNSFTVKAAVIQMCPDIHQYVIGLEDKKFCKRYFAKEISFCNSSGEKTLYITQNASGLGKNLDDVIKNLKNKYLTFIKADLFSWAKYENEWRSFNDKEKADIKATQKI